MKNHAIYRALNLAVLTVGLWPSASSPLRADPSDGPHGKIAVTAYSDFSIVPANLGPYIIPGTDGDLYLTHAPLVGKFTLTGDGVSIDGKVHLSLSGEVDATGTGTVWFPATVTATIGGVKTILFEGRGSANEVNLVATGQISLAGRGPYKGMKLELTFAEIGPGDSNTFNHKGYLAPAPSK
jgi:hypothetical protein